jgi:hypothetical protein
LHTANAREKAVAVLPVTAEKRAMPRGCDLILSIFPQYMTSMGYLGRDAEWRWGVEQSGKMWNRWESVGIQIEKELGAVSAEVEWQEIRMNC